jgi:aminoglycoside phosphotransferase (APT) family kinase protein
MARRQRGSPEWAIARHILSEVFANLSPKNSTIEVGRVRRLGEGAFRPAWGAWVELTPDAEGLSGAYTVSIPVEGTEENDHQRTRQEFSTLRFLRNQKLPFTVPLPIELLESPSGPAMVRTFIEGMTHTFHNYPQSGTPPWESAGRIAAWLHRLDTASAKPHLPGPNSRREFALQSLAIFDHLDTPELEPISDWCREHLPPDGPCCLLHGDLHGKNIIHTFDGPPAVIDWESASLGDPACEMSVITKGVRRPFKQPNGLSLLLDAYQAAGGEPIAPQSVHFYDLCAMALDYGSSLIGTKGQPAEQSLSNLQGLLRRASKTTASVGSPNLPAE